MMEEKYLLRQPKLLESMALKKIAQWIVSHAYTLAPLLLQIYPTRAQELLSRQIEITRDHIESRLPGRFHDKAMAELQHALCNVRIINDDGGNKVPKTMIGSVIAALFTKNITSLSFNSREWELYGETFLSESHLIPGLTQLTLRCGCVDDDLRFVEKNFKLIETFDLSYSGINDDCIDILIKLSNLKSVHLYGTEVSEVGIERLLVSCPIIEHIVTVEDIAEVINNIVNLDGNDERCFNLKSYLNKGAVPLELKQLLVRTCPLIEKLNMLLVGEYDKSLFCFKDLQHLRELVLHYGKFYTDQVKNFLLEKGNNLVYIQFHLSDEIDFSALKHIYAMCSNLQKLVINNCSYFDGGDYWENDKTPCKENILPLKYLKRLSVISAFGDRPLEQFIFLLSYCPNIEYIDMTACAAPVDNVILGVLDNFPANMMYLRELKISNDVLSESVMDRIVQNGVHPLEVKNCNVPIL